MTPNDYNFLISPEKWHRFYTDAVKLIRSLRPSDSVIYQNKNWGEIVATCDGAGLRCNFAERVGKGSREYILLENDVLLVIYNFNLIEPTLWNSHNDNYRAFSVVIKGADDAPHLGNSDEDSSNLGLIMTRHKSNADQLHFPGGTWVRAAGVILPTLSCQPFGIDLSSFKNELANSMAAFNRDESYDTIFYANDDAKRCVLELAGTHYEGRLRHDLYHIKAQELLCHLVGAYIDSKRKQIVFNQFSSSNRRALSLAKDILLSNLNQPPTISSLAIQVGLSRKKLISGFRLVYGESIHNFLVEKRMEKARALLNETEIPIGEIARKVGYTNNSGFYKVFVKKYGYSPQQFRQLS